MIDDPGDFIGELPPADKVSPPGTGRGCLPGCLLGGFGASVLFLVFVMGLGLPRTYSNNPREVQVLEGPDRVTLFVEVTRSMGGTGLIAGPPIRFAAALLRIEVFPDGRVERTALRSELEDRISSPGLTFNENSYTVVRLADGFYLFREPSGAARPAYRVGPERIERLSPAEAKQAVADEATLASGNPIDVPGLDAISAGRGWRRLNLQRELLTTGQLDSTRHGVRLRQWNGPSEGARDSIVAESLAPAEHWSHILTTVDRRPWRSYQPLGGRTTLGE